MAVVIDSGPVDAEDLLRHVPREKWRELMLARRRFCEIKLSYDCRCLVQFMTDAEEMYQALGFSSAEDMIRHGYGLEPEEIGVAVEWLKLNPPDDAISKSRVLKLAEREIGIPGGKAGPGRGHKTSDNITRFKRGTSREYTLARLDRDGLAELADKVRNKELSADAAAKAAGYRKQATPLEQILKLLPKLSDDELEDLDGYLRTHRT